MAVPRINRLYLNEWVSVGQSSEGDLCVVMPLPEVAEIELQGMSDDETYSVEPERKSDGTFEITVKGSRSKSVWLNAMAKNGPRENTAARDPDFKAGFIDDPGQVSFLAVRDPGFFYTNVDGKKKYFWLITSQVSPG